MTTFTVTLAPNGAKLSCYVQERSQELGNAEKRPAMLVFPGGGYMFCSDREAEPVALAYMAEGYNAFVLRYSVNCEGAFTKALQDAEAALEYLRSHTGELCIDPAKIAVIGFSAGGHLASALGTMGADKPDALILAYAVTTPFGPPEYKVPNTYEKVTEKTPPTFLFGTSDDGVVPGPNLLRFALALDEQDVYYEIHIYLTGAHGLSLAKPLTSNGSPGLVEPDVAAWFPASIRFLTNVFGDFQTGNEAKPSVLQMKLRPNMEMSVKRLLKFPAVTEIFERLMPGFADNIKKYPMVRGMALRELLYWSPDNFPEGIGEKLKEELAKL